MVFKENLSQECPSCGRPFWVGSAIMGVCSDACARRLRGNVDISEEETRDPRFRELDQLIDAGLGDHKSIEGCMILNRLRLEWFYDTGTDDVTGGLAHA